MYELALPPAGEMADAEVFEIVSVPPVGTVTKPFVSVKVPVTETVP